MKNKFLIFASMIFIMIISSCGDNETSEHTQDHPDLSQANRIVMDYKTDFDSAGKINIKTKEINDLQSIIKIRNTVTYDPFTYIYCVSTGSVSFYKDSTLIVTMVYNTLPDLRHIAFTYNGKLIAMSLSEDNAGLLDSFKN